MSKRLIAVVFLVAGLALGAAFAWSLGEAARVAAQDRRAAAPVGTAAPVAIAPGPGGMWIVYGNRLRVCVAGELPAGVQPFTPECGEPVALY